MIINSQKLKEKTDTKYLGVILDQNLSWRQHVDSILPKLQKATGILSKLRYYVPKNILRTVYFSLYQSHLNYNLLNWSCASQNILDQIKVSQNKTLRIMSFAKRDQQCQNLFEDFKILPLDQLIKLTQAKFMWKITNKQLPKCILDIFNPRLDSKRPIRNTNIGHNFVPLFRTSLKERFITNVGIQVWKNTPLCIQK